MKLCLHLSYARQISIQFNEFFDFKNVNKKSGEKFVELCLHLKLLNLTNFSRSKFKITWFHSSCLSSSSLMSSCSSESVLLISSTSLILWRWGEYISASSSLDSKGQDSLLLPVDPKGELLWRNLKSYLRKYCYVKV